MNRSYDPLTRTIRDVRIDDSDLNLAKNVFDYTLNYMGKDAKKPFARQLWILYMMAGEYCPRCADPRLGNIENVEVDDDPEEIADRAVLLHHGVCPKCRSKKSEMVLSGELNDYGQLVGVIGQRGGKSAMVTTACSYWMHRVLKVPMYSSMCSGIQAFTPLTFTFTALTLGRAKKLMWHPFVQIIRTSPWFTEYHAILRDAENRYGAEQLRFNKDSMFYLVKNVEAAPMSPMNDRLRGDTRIAAAIDELGLFRINASSGDAPNSELDSESLDDGPDDADNEPKFANADEVHTSLDSSLLTVRTGVYELYKRGIDHVPTGANFLISSPMSWKDKICRLLKESEGSKVSLGVHLPTWGVNPQYSRDHPYIVDMYRRNRIRAERDFGANPQEISSTRYDKDQIKSLFQLKHHFALTPVHTDRHQLWGKATAVYEPSQWPATVLALDAGYSNNSFAFALGAPRYSEGLTRIEVLALGEVIPRRGFKIDFEKVYKHALVPLMKEANVRFLFADRWNSIMLLQTAQNNHRLTSLQYTLKPRDFDIFDSDLVETGNIQFPKMEMDPDVIETVTDFRKAFVKRPSSHLYLQFLTVRESGGVVTKGDGYTDDIYRTVVLLATCARKPKVEEVLKASNTVSRSAKSNRSLVIVGGRYSTGIRSPRV